MYMSKKDVSAVLESGGSTSCVQTVPYALTAFLVTEAGSFRVISWIFFHIVLSLCFKSFTESATR